ncbi:MAG: lipopolysaccharide heptosyltransferase II [Planctomycetota bacterium]|nr:lipopolysaccharide heptosyltransferase II [Planctomycetota bacterium]
MSLSEDAFPAVERILVRGPNPVGDLVMATASFADIRRRFPRAHISMFLKPGRHDVVRGADTYDEILVDDSHEGRGSFLRLVRELRRRRFDLAILFTNSLRTALVVALADISARVGYAKGGQGVLLTHRAEPLRDGLRWRWKPRPMPEIYARLCEAAGVRRGDGRPRLFVTPECEGRAQERRRSLGVEDGEKLIGLVPGAGFGSSKLWPSAPFAELADLLSDRYGRRTIIFAGPGEAKIASELASMMKSRPLSTADHPLGLDLLKPFVRDLSLLVTMDTGPRHYAAAFRTPVVVIMGPTDPRWTAANLDESEIVRHDVPCGPCQLPTCPLDHRCMNEISAGEVLAHVQRLDERVGVFA